MSEVMNVIDYGQHHQPIITVNDSLARAMARIAELEADNARLAEGWKLNVEWLREEVARLKTELSLLKSPITEATIQYMAMENMQQKETIADLTAESRDFQMKYRMKCDAETKVLEQEVARLSDHIRAIAEHHDSLARKYGDDGEPVYGQYDTERRDFALSGLTTNVYQSTDELVAKGKS